MTAQSLHGLLAPVREHGRTVLAGCEDPHAELLALVWGPRFDRLHVQALLAQQSRLAPAVLQSVEQAAELFDHLPGAEQARVRQLILRHRAGGTMLHAPHLAD